MTKPVDAWTTARVVHAVEELRTEHEPARVPMREVFAVAKSAATAELDVIEELLERDDHQLRLVAVSIMDFQARRNATGPPRRQALFELYLRRHDRIDTWDIVDRAAPHVVGRFLADRDRQPLYDLARSSDRWRRRTAITATYYFIRAGDTDDTFAIATLLVDDPDEHVAKAVGGWIREAGKHHPDQLIRFLDEHAATMPRVSLRYAIEHLHPTERRHYLALKEH